jgi:hypothetical protein
MIDTHTADANGKRRGDFHYSPRNWPNQFHARKMTARGDFNVWACEEIEMMFSHGAIDRVTADKLKAKYK